MLLSLLLTGVTVTLPMEATVRGTEIELAEVATFEGNAEAVARLGAIELGYAPAPGYSRLLRADKIAAILRRKVPGVQIRFSGHAACRVRPEVRELVGGEIELAAREELLRTFGGSDFSVSLAQPIPATAVPLGDAPIEARARVLSDRPVSGPLSVPVEVLVDGVVYRTVWTSWQADVWETRSVLARAVQAGQSLQANMFERRRVQLGRGVLQEPLAESMLPGAVAARDLNPGEVVSATDVLRPLVLNLGDQIFLRVRKGGIAARVPAIALDSGAVGDRIRVRMNDSLKELSALILSPDLVEVNLGR